MDIKPVVEDDVATTDPPSEERSAGDNSSNRTPSDRDIEAKSVDSASHAGSDDMSASLHSDRDSRPGQKERQTLAKIETRRIGILRFVVFGILILTAIGVSGAVYAFTKKDQISDFEYQFHVQAIRILELFHQQVGKRLSGIDTLSTAYTAHALSTDAKFPNVTLPNFEIFGSNARVLSDAVTMFYSPVVTDDTRAGWEAYAQQNHQQLLSSYMSEEQLRSAQDAHFGLDEGRKLQSANVYQPSIYGYEGVAQAGNDRPEPPGTGPYLPYWQVSPIVPAQNLLNMNFLTFENSAPGYLATMRTGEAVLDKASIEEEDEDNNESSRATYNYYISLGQFRHDLTTYDGDPISPMFYPVFDSFDVANRKVAGVIATNIFWRMYFDDVLPDEVRGIVCVLENSHGQVFSFRLDGNSAVYLGTGDHHDSSFDHLVEEAEIISYIEDETSPVTRSYTSANLNREYINYVLRVYPTSTLEADYVTNDPVIYTIVVALVFAFTSAVFLFYDWLVEKRQSIVLDRAVKSSAVVSSLFPENVRDRIYNEQQNSRGRRGVSKDAKSQRDGHLDASDVSHSDTGDKGGGRNKFGWKSAEHLEHLLNIDREAPVSTSAPIADEFEATTIMFADIAGFTQWSSARRPEEVFHLLETLYGNFDRLARRYKVFKVETIGDSYLAATGLPAEQPDHAARMCKFARSCLQKMKELTMQLAERHGPDTMELEMRVGLHSGPVTAGVLRGEKSRFQLFGDTVNTASRMESCGVKGMIHCSQATADELIMTGHSHWLSAREEQIHPKGKTFMQTYFVVPEVLGSRSVPSIATRSERI